MALSRYRTGSLGSYVRTSQRGKSGGIYAGHDNHFYGHRKILKPEHLDWQEYALLLLNSMPEKQLSITAIKSPFICTGIRKGIEVPQTQQGDIGAKDIPSAADMQSFTQ